MSGLRENSFRENEREDKRGKNNSVLVKDEGT
jgi:hypothetical protein